MSSWAPNSYVTEGSRRGYSREFLRLLEEDGKKIASSRLPVVFTLGHLAAITDVPFQFLHEVVSRTLDPYRVFRSKKRSGGYRQIAVPDYSMLRVQRWIHQNILSRVEVHPSSMAYMPGCRPYNNAQRHCGAKWLVKVDVVRFFESISERQVYYVFKELGYRPLMAFEFARLATRKTPYSKKYDNRRWRNEYPQYAIECYNDYEVGHLPQGAPTSPILANLACRELDLELARLASDFRCTYTRYADDIVFSSNYLTRVDSIELIRRCSASLSKFGFKRNVQKTRIVPPGARKIVTGLLVNSLNPRLPRIFKDRIKCHLYFTSKHGVAEHCKRRGFLSLLGFREHLIGLIRYAEEIEPDFGSKCREEFGRISWPFI